MAGYAGYRYIYATYNDGKTTIPYGYTYYANNKLYEFTLGNNVYVTDMSSMKETVWKLSDLSEHYFSNALTNENFRIVTIMTAINNFLNTFYNDGANVIAYNAGTGLEFDLGMVDYASDDVNVMEKLSAVIDGPSFFAVVDTYDTLTNRTVRLFSLGAAEYKSLVA